MFNVPLLGCPASQLVAEAVARDDGLSERQAPVVGRHAVVGESFEAGLAQEVRGLAQQAEVLERASAEAYPVQPVVVADTGTAIGDDVGDGGVEPGGNVGRGCPESHFPDNAGGGGAQVDLERDAVRDGEIVDPSGGGGYHLEFNGGLALIGCLVAETDQ